MIVCKYSSAFYYITPARNELCNCLLDLLFTIPFVFFFLRILYYSTKLNGSNKTNLDSNDSSCIHTLYGRMIYLSFIEINLHIMPISLHDNKKTIYMVFYEKRINYFIHISNSGSRIFHSLYKR